jgi:hypothetical protein
MIRLGNPTKVVHEVCIRFRVVIRLSIFPKTQSGVRDGIVQWSRLRRDRALPGQGG